MRLSVASCNSIICTIKSSDRMRELSGVNDERVRMTEYGKEIGDLVFISAALFTLRLLPLLRPF